MTNDLLPLAAGLLKQIPQAAQFSRDVTAVSPTQAAARNTVVSRVYVEESLARLDITPNVLKAAQSMYAGMLLMIMDRANEISSGRTVADSMNKVYTRGMGVENYRDVADEFSALAEGCEKLRPETNSLKARMPHLYKKSTPGLESDGPDKTNYGISADSEGGVIAPPDLLPVGQVLKVTLVGKDSAGNSVKHDTLVGVRMTPYIVGEAAMVQIVSHGYSPNFKMRWMQWKAGEISFWKDLVFQADRIRKMEASARADKSGAYASFLGDTARRDRDRAMDILYNLPTPHQLSNNLANSVIVVSEDTIKRAAADTGFDLTDTAQRQKFLHGSYVMMLFVVDPNYHQVTLYMNGHPDPQHYSFNDFSPKKKSDPADFLQMFAQMSGAGARPSRF